MDDVEELVIKPFREVVEKGKLAVENAANSPDMLKEAQRLVKVGERGLSRIETSCKKLYTDYSSNFVAALKENGRQPYPLLFSRRDAQLPTRLIWHYSNCLLRTNLI